MPPKRRPHRLSGVPYDEPGLVFHCRLGTWDRSPSFAQANVAQVAVDALRYYHGRSVDVLAYCVMPDHVHLLVRMLKSGTLLSSWVGDFKKWVSRNSREQHHTHLRWQPGFYERVVRDSEDLAGVGRYIVANPVRAGLTGNWRDYPWSGSFVYEL